MFVNQLNEALKKPPFMAYEEEDAIIVRLKGREDIESKHEYKFIGTDEQNQLYQEFGTKQCLKKYMRHIGRKGIMHHLGQTDFRKPAGFEVHHNFPLRMGGKNEIENFRLVPTEVHKKLHALIWTPLKEVLEQYALSEKRRIFVALPPTPQLLTSVEKMLKQERAHRAIAAEATYLVSYKEVRKRQAAVLIQNRKKRNDRIQAGKKRAAFLRRAHEKGVLDLLPKPKREMGNVPQANLLPAEGVMGQSNAIKSAPYNHGVSDSGGVRVATWQSGQRRDVPCLSKE